MDDRGYKARLTECKTLNGEVYFMADHPELPGCLSDGATREEAEENWQDALSLYLRHFDEIGRQKPRKTT